MTQGAGNLITADMLLEAYQHGVFPMAPSREESELGWFRPIERGILPLHGFNIPRSLRKFMAQDPFEIRYNTAFEAVMQACAEPTPGREESWINDTLIRLYSELHTRGYAHSVECWQDDVLVGGLYGVHIGAAFFGESMFSRTANASKVALVYLVERLRKRHFHLLDTQYVNEHLKQFGVIAIPHEAYMERLADALEAEAEFP